MLITASAALISAVLIGFHAVLLWQRVLDQSLFRPVPVIRWLLTLALVMGIYRLHHRGISFLRGRGALIFWLLILLLHVSFLGPLAEPSSTGERWTGYGLLLALPAISVVLGILLPSIRRRFVRAYTAPGLPDLPFVAFWEEGQSYALRSGLLPALACRPPPAV